LILIEGLDNTGKTTLAEKILGDFPQLHMRPSIGNKHDLNLIRQQAHDEAMNDHPLMVADRSRLVSEYVYNPVLQGRELAYPYISWLFWLAHFTSKEHTIIYWRRDMGRLREEFDAREQLEGVAEKLTLLDFRYEQMMTMLDFLFQVQPDNMSHILTYNFDVQPAQYSYIKNQIEYYLGRVGE